MSLTHEQEVEMRADLEDFAHDAEILSSLLIGIEKMEYQGFDPLLLLNHMKEKSTQGGGDFKRDVMTMAVIGTMRGSQVMKIKNKSTKDLVAVLDKMAKIYGLTSGTPKTNTTVTLIRVAACMARPLSLGLHRGTLNIRTTVDPSLVSDGFPKCMCLSTFGSLIPAPGANSIAPEHTNILLKAFSYHQYKFDEIINSRGAKGKTNIEVIGNFVNIQHQSTLYKQLDRLAHCVEVGILRKDGIFYTILPTVLMSLHAAKTKWEALSA